jgi:hypothetical protein
MLFGQVVAFLQAGARGITYFAFATRRARAAMHEFSTFQGAAPTPAPPFFYHPVGRGNANDSQQSFLIESSGLPPI